MDTRLILKIFGLLLIIFSFSMIPPMLLSWQDFRHDGVPFSETFLIMLMAGLFMLWPVRSYQRDLRKREGFLVVTLFWVMFSALGAIPFMLSDSLDMSFTDAFFESMSGFTTTGATVISGLDDLPKSILFYRQELQWFGGMGIIVLAVAILPVFGIGGLQLFQAESPGPIKDAKLTPRIKETAKTLYIIYLLITLFCALTYRVLGMDWFDAVAHSLSTVANGGFSTHDASFAWFDSAALEVAAIFFMAFSGVNFALHYSVWRAKSLSPYWSDSEFRAYFWILLGASALVSVALAIHDDYKMLFPDLHHGSFQLVSFMTTSGFGVAEFASWPTFVPMLLVLSGFIGGCSGSTAGGIKVIRIVILFRRGLNEARHLMHPSGRFPVMLGKHRVEGPVIRAVWGFFALYIMLFILIMLLIMADGVDQVTAFSAVAACINNVGPGLGRVAYSFAEMSDWVKWLSSFAMLLGRLEIFTVLVLFSPLFWRS
ncbi:MAG: TrkH family potassium uptake protein [Thiolinea sp.]